MLWIAHCIYTWEVFGSVLLYNITELALSIILVQVFYFFTVLLNYGIIKVIESYKYKGFEGKSPGESEDTKWRVLY